MTILVRAARAGEGGEILTIHRRAVHEAGRADYGPEILQAWSPMSAPEEIAARAARFDRKIERGEIIVVAEVDGAIAGFGELVPAENMLLALYVNPDNMRRGVGAAILLELERLAREQGLNWLGLNSSLTAERFYKKNGYRVIEPGSHSLGNNLWMPCVKMRKDFSN